MLTFSRGRYWSSIWSVFFLREECHHPQLWPWVSVLCCSALSSSSVQVRLSDGQVNWRICWISWYLLLLWVRIMSEGRGTVPQSWKQKIKQLQTQLSSWFGNGLVPVLNVQSDSFRRHFTVRYKFLLLSMLFHTFKLGSVILVYVPLTHYLCSSCGKWALSFQVTAPGCLRTFSDSMWNILVPGTTFCEVNL